MKLTIVQLRKFIREEVERNCRWSAGLAPGGVGKGNSSGRMGPINYVPPGLGSEEEEDLDGKEQEEKSQIGAKVAARKAGKRR